MSKRAITKGMWGLLLVLAALSANGFAETPPDPLALFRKAVNPPVPFTCKIVVTSWHSPKGETALLREWRLPDGRYRIEYLAPRKLSGTVLISDGKRRWRIVNGQAIWDLTIDELTAGRLNSLSQNYDLKVLKPMSVINRKGWLVAITPKVKGKPHFRFVLDAEHGIPLKGELLSGGETPVAFMAVTELKILKPSEIDPKLFSAPKQRLSSRNYPKPLSKPEAQRKWSVRLPDRLPFGFAFERVEEVPLLKKSPVLHAVYSDGLTRISLFILPKGQKIPSVSTRVKAFSGRINGRTFLLLGSVSERLLRQIATSIAASQEHGFAKTPSR